jgi:V8-like Glu-specific endopeptidase
LRSKFEKVASEIVSATTQKDKAVGPSAKPSVEAEPADMLSGHNELVLQALAKDDNFLRMLHNNGTPWRGVVQKIEQTLSTMIDDQEKITLLMILPGR